MQSNSQGTPGRYVELEDTVSGFEAILSGEADEIPENSFAYVGSIDEAFDKSSKDEKTTKKETKNEDLQDSSRDEAKESEQEVSEKKDEAPVSKS